MIYSIQDIARIIQADAPPTGEAAIEHLLLDSRKLVSPAGTLFFALAGPRRNGHQFIPELYRKGVRHFVVSEKLDTAPFEGAHFLFVPDTLAALQQLAAFHRAQFSFPVIGITGSNGKTIVKEWLYQLLHADYAIVRSPKSFNSQIGVPLSVWQMGPAHNLGIFEAGISTVGEMEKLEKIIRPAIGIITNIGDAHNEGFRDKEEKLREKIRLFENTEWVVCHSRNKLDKEIKRSLGKVNLFTCGTNRGDDVKILSIQKESKSVRITLETAAFGQEPGPSHQTSFRIPFTDDASVDNAILCFTVCCLLGRDPALTAIRMEQLEPVEMRMEVKKGINNCTLINDSYSNDISSLGIALDYLMQQAGNHNTTVILSDILQSGIPEDVRYSRVAGELKNRRIARFIGIGEQLSAHYRLFREAAPEVSFYLSTDHFLAEATSHQFREEFILLKGARPFAFERISKWLEQKVHQTLLEINLNALAHNLKQYQQCLLPSTKVMAMVKAFAYGSGGAEIAGILQYHKADYLGVAYADEGVDLRNAGISLPIMVMNPEANSFDAILQHRLEPELYSFELLESFGQFLEKEGVQQYPVHIEVETGMNRLGFMPGEMEELGERLRAMRCFSVQSVFSHLAASEEAEQDEFTALQFERFNTAAGLLQQKLGYPFLRHIANSAAILRHPSLQLDMVRLGIGLYGVDSSGSDKLDLQTVATLRTTVAQVKQLGTGESVSYNRSGKLMRPSVVATVRLGYADGYPRRLGNGAGKMYIRGKLAPVIGTVCMDMTMLDVTGIPGVREGDDVIVFGPPVPVQQVAAWAGTIPYEIMTGISQRVKRVYFEE